MSINSKKRSRGHSVSKGRQTQQKQALLAVFERSRRPLTPRETLEKAQETVRNLGLATVYRGIRRLVDTGLLAPVRMPGEPVRYERADQGHHHHFRCDLCLRVFNVPGCLRGLISDVPPGFVVRDHVITLEGQCADCAVPRR